MKLTQTPEAAPANRRITSIECVVSRDDIEEMLDRFDSGMADIRSANAVAVALNRRLDLRKRGLMSFSGSGWVFRFEEGAIELPDEVTEWMESWSKGLTRGPFRFFLHLHEEFARVLGVLPVEKSGASRFHGRELPSSARTRGEARVHVVPQRMTA